MVHKNLLKLFILSFICVNSFTAIVNAGEPEMQLKLPVKQFYVKAGTGYGLTNRMVKGDENTHVHGTTFNLALGYQISEQISVSFGPSLWVDNNDLLKQKSANESRPSNKKMSVQFVCMVKPFKKFNLILNGGLGVGTVVYSPSRSTVAIDGKQATNAEYHGGFSYAAGLGYSVKLKPNFKLLPMVQYSGLNLNEKSTESYHLINTRKNSFLLETGVNLIFDF